MSLTVSLGAMAASLFLAAAPVSDAEPDYDALAERDAAIFVAAFDECDIEKLETLFTEDFEFYHDRSGQIADSRAEFLDDARRGCEARARGDNEHLRRELDEASVKIYPMEKYGAIQMGDHSFYRVNDDGSETLVGHAKFIHLWRFKDGEWRVAREYSYDHQNVN